MSTASEPPPTPSPRRAAPPESARRTSARTREKILDAAVAEFGAKGFAGARTAEIAARAGVNQQLIAYHFGGKQGLLDELRARWAGAESARAAGPGATLAESVRAYLDLTLDRPDWSRLVVWRALGDTTGTGTPDGSAGSAAPGTADSSATASNSGGSDSRGSSATPPDDQSARLRAAVDRFRARQAAGEIADDLDPAFALLLCYALTFAPIALPHFVRDITGLDPLCPEYRDRCAAEIVKLLTPCHERPNA